ncbi:MAG TPA: cyanophycinase [Woeseiaceae bacterium]|nr:cyanophycinase [Woeseiaceae bacterium]
MSMHTMLTRWAAAAVVAVFGATMPAAQSAPVDGDRGGVLVIAGGSVKSDNEALYRAFIDAMPEDGGKTVAVISAASLSPVASARRFAELLASYGVPEDRTTVVQLAVCDDESTPDIDESDWSGNASDSVEIAKIQSAAAIWISGGDQSRLTDVLFDDNGEATPMLVALRQRFAEGAVVGGTSAGAAVMSDPMITGGDSIAALLNSEAAGEMLTSARGFGFFDAGLVDQHFGQRARFGRLAVALQLLEPARRLGFGIDENTALVYRSTSNSIAVIGTGSVTFLDARGASWRSLPGGIFVSNLRVSVLSPGDTMNLSDGSFTPAPHLRRTAGNEYHKRPAISGGGITLAYNGLADLIGAELLDNSGANQLERYGFIVKGGQLGAGAEESGPNGAGARFRFTQTAESEGYWGYGADGAPRYSVRNVRVDIEPVSLAIRPAGDTRAGQHPVSPSR